MDTNNCGITTLATLLLFCSVFWIPVKSQVPFLRDSDNSDQPKRSGVSGDLLLLQSRSNAVAAAASGRPLGRSPSSTSVMCANAMDCSDEKKKAICGTDGRTYYSRCEITKAKCEGHMVEFKHKGKCPENGRCLAQRAQAQDQSRKFTNLGIIVPECREDGSFHEVQCHESTGYCWCVDEKGKPISRSSVRHKKPNCAQQGSRRMNRRRTSSKGPRDNKACSSTDRSTFNHNLIEIFRSEYTRIIPSTTTDATNTDNDPLLDTEQKKIVQWKFTQLDQNSDNNLKRKEVRDLRRMVKKIVRPRSCAKTFTKYCDLDHDKKITRNEWSTCLGVDMNNEHLEESLDGPGEERPRFPLAHRQHRPPIRDDFDHTDDEDKDEDDNDDDDIDDHEEPPVGDRPHMLVSDSQISSVGEPMRRTPMGVNLEEDDDWTKGLDDSVRDAAGSDSKEEDFSDCLSARRSATEQYQQAPEGGHFIPNCTPEGSYQLAQCHSGICWCVHEKSGKTIHGTAIQGNKPDCEAAMRSAKAFKGCSLKKKRKFTEEYAEFLAKEMAEYYKNKSQSVTTDEVTKEQVARWKMTALDTNKNQVLDRKEWKAFRKDWRSFKKGNPRRTKLRKCWRNYLRYCDKNLDHRITTSEWLTCTSSDVLPVLPGGSQFNPVQGTAPAKGNNGIGRRKGKNPFDSILKGD